jgi:hypothetical protein
VLILVVDVPAILVFWPSKGRIVVRMSDARGGAVEPLDIYVDGRKSPCDTTPCYLEEGTGSDEVKVVADGYDPAAQAIVVDPRKDVPATFVFSKS